uniref:Uncharacterized protein n=1 Tax=Panagrolaimus davidi TaxID=227884 RepID=A0A914PEX8_9BILA
MPIILREKYRKFSEYELEQQIPDNSSSSDRNYRYDQQHQPIPYYQQPTILPNNNISSDEDNNIITIEDNNTQDLTKPLSLQFSNHLDRIDRNWRNDPFWRDLYPRWAEPIFKEGIDIKANIVNDRQRK